MVCLILPPHPMTVRWLAFPGETLIPLTQKAFVAQQWNMRAQEWDKPPIQQLHTLIPLVGNLWHSWGNFTYNHFPLIYIYPMCTLCIYPCSLYVFPSLLSLHNFLLGLPWILVLFLLSVYLKIWLQISIMPSTPCYTLKSSTGIAFPLFFKIWK